jgi:thioredoxin-like negative regulator of GroEL
MKTTANNGFCLVLFYSTHCKFCKNAIDVFKQLPKNIQGCSFGMINLSTNAKTHIMSKSSTNEIQYVPFIILYKDGIPRYQYKDELEITSIANFIVYVAGREKNSFTEETVVEQKEEKVIPAYTIGKPVCDDNVCYMSFDGAYTKQ